MGVAHRQVLIPDEL